MTYRDIVILANSRRHGAHCIAGKDRNTNEWVRPITIFGGGRDDPEAFSDSDLKTLTGFPSGPGVLDCVRIGFGKKSVKNCQPENIFVDGKFWEKIGLYPRDQLSKLVDAGENCFLGKDDLFTNDRIPVSIVKTTPLTSSLNLVKLSKEKNSVRLEHTKKPDGTFKHRMNFTYDTKSYRIKVTDSYYEKVYQEMKIDDSVVFDDFFMTIGVGADEFSAEFAPIPHHYRLIVGIIPSNDLKEYSLR